MPFTHLGGLKVVEQEKKISRRHFLKILGVMILSAFLSPLIRFFTKQKESQSSSLKEAKYYTSHDDLLG